MIAQQSSARGRRGLRAAMEAGRVVIAVALVWPGVLWAQGAGRSVGGSIPGRTSGGATGSPGNQVQAAQQNAGQLTGSERYVRGARDPNAFVGADSGDTQALASRVGSNQGLAGQGMNRLNVTAGRNSGQGQFGANAFNAMGLNRRQLPRRRLSVNFAYQPRPLDGVAETLSGRLSNFSPSLSRRALSDPAKVTVTMEGEQLVLRGTVASEEERLLAERLARLEPGVWEVRNELAVAATSPPGPPTE